MSTATERLLVQAHEIVGGDTRALPHINHLHVLVDEILRLKDENTLLRRALADVARNEKEDMNARDAWANQQEGA